ncbi:MAG: hypothetical protein MI743_19690 [Sneathiellales bacterium]|nr:hypothetical protein [Sneathiellales bacterium]
MFKRNSLITRIAIGKSIGLVVGLVGFLLLPLFSPEVPLLFRWGILLWYITVGAFIGVFGVFTWHPILHLPMPWWFRSSIIGAWMNFVLTLFTYEQLHLMMLAFFSEGSLFQSPFWLVLEGAVIGLVIGYVATRIGGEGKEIIDEEI